MSQQVFSSDAGGIQNDSISNPNSIPLFKNATCASEASLRMEEMSGLLSSIKLNAENLPACEEKRAILSTAKIGASFCINLAAYFQDVEEKGGGE